MLQESGLLYSLTERCPMVSPLRASRLAQDIDKLCTECASLIDNHDKIKDLSAVHYNLGKTLQDVENIVALPQQAAEAEDMLKDDTQLSEVCLESPGSVYGPPAPALAGTGARRRTDGAQETLRRTAAYCNLMTAS